MLRAWRDKVPDSIDFEFDPFSLPVQEDPYPFYKVLRDRFPLYWSEGGDCWCLSRYDDILFAASHPEIFSSAEGNILDDFPGRAGATLGTTDPPKHDHLRRLINEVFTRRRVDALEPAIRAGTRQHLGAFVAAGGGCIQNEVIGRVTSDVIAELLGFGDDGRSSLKGWVDGILHRDPETRRLTEHGQACLEAIGGYVRGEVERRYAERTEDLIGAMVGVEVDGDRLEQDEIVWLVFTLIGAGIESTSSTAGNALVALEDHPDQRASLAADLSLMPGAIEETLRYDTSAQRFRRTAAQDHPMHGKTIRAGDKVLLMYGSGNRDERQFDDPDRFDIRRPVARNLAFGYGIHFCLGAALARLVLSVLLEEILAAMPNYATDRGAAERMHSPTFRGFVRLPMVPGDGAVRAAA